MNAGIDRILHEQAVKALEQSNFFIVANEFEMYDSDRKPRMKYSKPTDVISMRGGKVVIKNVYDFPINDFEPFVQEWNVVKAMEGEMKKNGDATFGLRIRREGTYPLEREIAITLFAGTNKCYVKVGNYLSFKGHVFPASTEVLRDPDPNVTE